MAFCLGRWFVLSNGTLNPFFFQSYIALSLISSYCTMTITWRKVDPIFSLKWRDNSYEWPIQTLLLYFSKFLTFQQKQKKKKPLSMVTAEFWIMNMPAAVFTSLKWSRTLKRTVDRSINRETEVDKPSKWACYFLIFLDWLDHTCSV